jgi:hypothetical protein
MAHFGSKLAMYINKACSFYFDKKAKRFKCDDQGLRYSSPSDQVQLRHISGQLTEFLLSLENV